MRVSFAHPGMPETGTLVLLVAPERTLGPAGQRADAATGGMLTRAMAASRFSGKKDETLAVLAPPGLSVTRVLLVGLGDSDEKGWSPLAIQAAGGNIVAALNRSGETTGAIAIDAPDGQGATVEAVAADLAYGGLLRAYRFGKYKTTEKPEQKPTLESITVRCPNPDAASRLFTRHAAIAQGVFLTRDLVSEPANVLTPAALAEQCRDLAPLGVEVEILDPAQLKALGMNALLGVAMGSANEPRVVVLRYRGSGNAGDSGGADEGPIAFCGKGVTFDSGGISIKPSGGMEDMKWDMGGAAVVMGLMKALAGRRAAVDVVGVVGLVENMPSGTAQRPGDIVTSMSGQTIEVLNTDAEGRLVLADVLWYTQDRFKPRLMIDLATLTGAVIVALGNHQAGLFANDDELAERLTAAGRKSGEPVWRLPMGELYDKDINSDVADMKNIGTAREAGSIIGAQFLQRFVNNVPWAHLDIAGVTWTKKETSTVPKGGTGYGVRLLDSFLADHYEAMG